MRFALVACAIAGGRGRYLLEPQIPPLTNTAAIALTSDLHVCRRGRESKTKGSHVCPFPWDKSGNTDPDLILLHYARVCLRTIQKGRDRHPRSLSYRPAVVASIHRAHTIFFFSMCKARRGVDGRAWHEKTLKKKTCVVYNKNIHIRKTEQTNSTRRTEGRTDRPF